MHLGLVKKNTGLMQYITKDKSISNDPIHTLFVQIAKIILFFMSQKIITNVPFTMSNNLIPLIQDARSKSQRAFARYSKGKEYGPFDYNIDNLDDKTDNNDKSSTKNFNNPKIMAAIEEGRSSENLNSDKLIANCKELFNTSNPYAIDRIVIACNNVNKQLNSHL
ncbi:hypothetical protein F8M41_002590 [Gigaspora margarita]|uniref:Uncharacterized protein n=1 Tax=Gigaspora margarita TaxID=4874 RepID=A0A8H3XDD5_GIGMA|nr:hypothetical protein F8M41_002590 [Gigaspora margarita]